MRRAATAAAATLSCALACVFAFVRPVAAQIIAPGGGGTGTTDNTARNAAAAAQQTANAALTPTGSGASLTGITAAQVGAASVAANAATQISATLAQMRAASISAAEYGLVCDAVEIPYSINGVYQYSTLQAGYTDNTTAIANFVAALGVANGSASQGAGGETTTGPIHQRRGIMPPNCSYAVTSWPASIPEAVEINGNQSSGYITSANGHGPMWDSVIGTGTSNNTAHGFRLVYAGPIGQSTNDGITFLGGGFNKAYDNDVFGFRAAIGLGATEYTNIYSNNFSHNIIGIMDLAASFANGPSSPSAYGQYGTPSINNNFWGNTYRGNLVNIWLNGATTSVIGMGSASFGVNSGIVLGALDFNYVDTIAMSGTSACTASATIPLTFTDANGTLLPEGILKTNSSGVATGAFSVNGGKVSSGVTISVPTSSTLGCTTAPTLTPHIASMASHLPFTGVASAGNGQNIIEPQNIENEGTDANGNFLRPKMGYQIMADSSVGDLYIMRPMNGLDNSAPELFAHFMLNQGVNTKVYDPLVYGFLDPVTQATCPFVSTTKMFIDGPGHDQDNSGFICNSSYTTDYATQHGITGWDNGLFQTHGFSGYGFGSASDYFLSSHVPGDTYLRMECTVAGKCLYSNGSSFYDISVGRLSAGVYGLDVGTFQAPAITSGGQVQIPGAVTVSGTAAPSLMFNSNGTARYYPAAFGFSLDNNFNPTISMVGNNTSFRVARGDTQNDVFSVSATGLLHENLNTPASSSATCNVGDFGDDAGFHYVCVATNTWKRVALSSF